MRRPAAARRGNLGVIPNRARPAEARPREIRTEDERRLAVREGFEPSVEVLRPYNGLANRRLQPLGHLTAVRKCNRSRDLVT